LGVATAKGALIFFYFMRLRERPGLIRLFALAGFFWLAILMALTFADFFTRG
jgi:cytochrome c oxidase subunit 4